MEFKGTKGKWYFDKEKAKVYKENGNTLCVCYHTSIYDKEESEPNALLISKAPEMLEMLKKINHTTTLHGKIDNGSDLHKNLIKLIKEATEI